MKKIRVIVADDSALMRKKISEILNTDPDIEVVATAKNGREALDAVYALRPDVVTLDVEMPILNGIDTLGYIMSEIPTPCVMISAFTKTGASETVRSLEFGAVDFVTKPGGVISLDIGDVGQEIIKKVRVAASVPVKKLKLLWPEKARDEAVVSSKPAGMNKLVVIASSTGGTQALATLLPHIDSNIPAGILIVQHMPEGFTKSLAERLNWQSKISVIEAEEGLPIRAGQAILARGGFHMEVLGSPDRPKISLNQKPQRHGVRPSADVTMESAAELFKENTVGIILTGMGSDGTLGAKAIKDKKGYMIAESEESCVIYGMPKCVIEAGLADKVAPLNEIAGELARLVK